MNTRERIITVLESGTPDITPYLLYDGMMDGKWNGVPEGDMLYDECRSAWPDKVLLCSISVGLYALPPDQLRQAVEGKIQSLGK